MPDFFRRLFVILLFLFIKETASCQEFPMVHYAFEDGLPSNTIYQIYRDSKGFLWMGTDKGVARYNGIKFETFTTFNGLPDNEIYFFREDYYGRLWIGTSNGKLCYYQNDTFHTEKNTPFLKLNFKIAHTAFISLEVDSSLTFSFYGYSTIVNVFKDRISVFDFNKAKLREPKYICFQKRKIDAGTYELYYLDNFYLVDTLYNIIKVVKQDYDDGCRATFSQDQEYVHSDNFFYTPDLNKIGAVPDNKRFKCLIYTIYYDSVNYFFTTNKGLIINDTLRILKDIDVTSITQDNIGNYWVSTQNNGIFCIRKDFMNTRVFRNIYTEWIRYCKTVDKKVFYVTTDNNLNYLEDGKPKCIFNYKKFKKKDYKEPNDAAYLITRNYDYYSFYNDDHIVIHNVLSQSPVINNFSGISNIGGVKTVISDGSNIYLKTRDRLLQIDYAAMKNGDKLKYKYVSDSSRNDRIFGIAKDQDNMVWYATINNMFKVQDRQGIPQRQFNTTLKALEFFHKYLVGYTFDNNLLFNTTLKAFEFFGKYLVGYTFDNNLLFITNYNETLKIDSIKSENCVWNNLYKINDSMMLITTNNFDRLLTVHLNDPVHPYSLLVIEDPFVPLNTDAFCANESNCYFFKNGSVTVVNTNILLEKHKPPSLFFSLLKTAKYAYHIRNENELEIPYSESKNIAISYATCSFAGKSVSYQYSFSKNEEDNWIDVKGETINLVNPGYGTHIMKLRSRTITSNSSSPIVFTLHILKPYWATWWFILSLVCLALILTGIIIRLRVLYLVRKKERLHESEIKFLKLEYKALNALMNPHFIFNALNNVQALINKNEKLAANKYLGIFADLIRQNMHNISLELIPLYKEMDIVENYLKLEKLRFKDHLNYEVNIDDNVDMSEVMIPPLLIQPLVENAVKHGIFPRKSTDSTVIVEVHERNNFLVISVKDNGIGVEAAKKRVGNTHKSTGLNNIRKRIAQLAVIQNKQITFNITDTRDEAGKLLWTTASISISLS